MYRMITLTCLVVASQFALANSALEIDTITCEIAKASTYHRNTSQFSLQLRKLSFAPNHATIKAYSGALTSIEKPDYDVIPSVQTTGFEGRNLVNVPYEGRRYRNHFKFNLMTESKIAGAFSPDRMELIVDPNHTVVKTIPAKNNWDHTWTWDVEVRKHSAALNVSFNDHHGDYIPLDCYSVATVNDSKGRN